ncbi:hypothetical protein ACHAPT_011191, partial [Fusarium lateritium]
TYRCPNSGIWLADTSIFGDSSTYAHCAGESPIPGDLPLIATTCSDNTVYWTTPDATDTTASGSRDCQRYSCITVTIYDSYGGGSGSGPQYWIDCAENLRPPEGEREFYRALPESTTSESTESSSSTKDLSAAGSTDTSLASSTTSDSSTTATEEPDDKGDKGDKGDKVDKGLSSGAIAGIAIGSVLGGILITSLIVLAFWLGKRSRGGQSESVREDQAKTEAPSYLPAELGGSVPAMQPMYVEGRT